MIIVCLGKMIGSNLVLGYEHRTQPTWVVGIDRIIVRVGIEVNACCKFLRILADNYLNRRNFTVLVDIFPICSNGLRTFNENGFNPN